VSISEGGVAKAWHLKTAYEAGVKRNDNSSAASAGKREE